ncbi:SMI1/KNR4 family protein [Jeotgalibacillus soli]|uniref:Knr4/Smi1-like domain-containing protein n=1 Tax=Jeotgalibacillus soli TaxID=889306 RepID=A0A0C2V891_9BACL|nr:SMI1/KNR4 family protein [Jeotgalibacillus soli]KIL45177.1 hypothetical protein KP78_27210 [Jeotgalibacillus soli]
MFKSSALDAYELEELNNSIISQVENDLKVILPKSYKDLMETQNGGYLNFNKYPVSFFDDADHIAIDYIFGIGINKNEGILQSDYYIKEWEMPKNLVILYTAGPSGVALDYREIDTSDEPKVIYYDVETGQDEIIAKSFDEFQDKLYNDGQNIYLAPDMIFEEDKTEFTYEEGDKAFKNGTISEIGFALIFFAENKSNTNWFLKHIKNLSKHKNRFIVMDAEEALLKIINERINEKDIDNGLIKETINEFSNHSDNDVQNFAKKINKKYLKLIQNQ